MRTRSPNPRLLIVPGLFALVCIVLTFATWDLFGGSTPLAAKGYRATLALPQASNLFPGSDVRIAGVSVGKVKEVGRSGSRSRVEIELDPEVAPLRAGATAILRTKTLLGEAYVAIAPGPRTARAVPDGGALPARGIRTQQRLDDVLSTFEAGTRSDLRSLFGGVADAFGGREQDVGETIGEGSGLAGDLRVVLGALDEQRPALQQVIAGSGDVLAAASERDGALREMVEAGSQVVDATGRRDRALRETLRELPGFATRLTSTARSIEGAADDLDGAVSTLRPAAALLPGTLAEIERAAPTFRSLFTNLTPVLRAGEKGLPAVGTLARSLDPALKGTQQASRQLAPLLRLFAVSRRSVIGTFANVGQIQNGTMVGPGGRVIHYGNGLPTLWNEIVGGWVKRLPTNRQNPYPKPDSALDIGTGGLKSYDCRNTGNTPYLAAFGGAPPCLTQGPWTFDGKTRQFPHLELDPP